MAWQDRDYNHVERGGGGGGGRLMGGRLGSRSVVTWLLVINVLILMWDGIFGESSRANVLVLRQHGYYTFETVFKSFQVWRLLTYQFLHADFLHLLFNMIGLYFFGPMLESWWGSKRFTAFYLLCGASGAVIYTAMSFVPDLLPRGGIDHLIGASGSIFGILAGAAVIAPKQRVMLMFPPIPMQMRTLVLVFLGIAVISVLAGSRNAGGEAAHLGGALLGFLLVKFPKSLSWAGGMRTPDIRSKIQAAAKKREKNHEASEDAEIDRILEKVKAQGMQSLTSREKKTLQRATDRQRKA